MIVSQYTRYVMLSQLNENLNWRPIASEPHLIHLRVYNTTKTRHIGLDDPYKKLIEKSREYHNHKT